jgi:hypothetical protein
MLGNTPGELDASSRGSSEAYVQQWIVVADDDDDTYIHTYTHSTQALSPKG